MYYNDAEVEARTTCEGLPLTPGKVYTDLRDTRRELKRLREAIERTEAKLRTKALDLEAIAEEWKQAGDWPAYGQTMAMASENSTAATIVHELIAER